MNKTLRALLAVLVLAFAACGQTADDLKQHDTTAEQFLNVCAAGATLPGIDVSSYQGSINWAQVAGSGIKWGYAKATEDTGYHDATFPGNWAGMKANGIARGAYHFFHPETDGKQQADYFLAYVGTLGEGDLPPMLDWEITGSVSGATADANAHAFIDEVQAKTGKTTVIYTSPGLWSGFGTSGFGAYPLIVADYFNCLCTSGVCPAMPGGWSNWVAWQYSSSGNVPGISGHVDLDIFNGDAATLAGLAGGAASCSNPIAVGHPIGTGTALTGPCGGAAPTVTTPTACGTIPSGEGLSSGKTLTSCDGRFELAMQGDGNAVVYTSGIALWNTHTGGTAGEVLVMQGDGNLVLYSNTGCAMWDSGTAGHSGATLSLQDDGNMVIYSGGTAIWSSGTGPIGTKPAACGKLAPGEGLAPGESVTSCGGCFELVMQGDGNLVMYKIGANALWNSGTAGASGYVADMQGDGNFVLYSSGGCPLWNSGSGGHSGAYLAVQDDGNLVVYGAGNAVLWDSGAIGCSGGCTCNAPPPPPPPPPVADAGSPHPVEDAGSPHPVEDAGSTEHTDAGTAEHPDGGSTSHPADAGSSEHLGDGGTLADGGHLVVDAGVGIGTPVDDVDAGSGSTAPSGGCTSAGGSSGVALLGLLALGLRRRRS